MMQMSNRNRVVVICVESPKSKFIDQAYIDKVIKTIYQIPNDLKISYISMESKSRYNYPKVKNDLKKAIKDFSESEVVYCVDLDNYKSDYAAEKLNNDIEGYCERNNYRFVWFCRDIEEVFLHEKIADSEKYKKAKRFNSKIGIGKATVESLSQNTKSEKKSNFLIVFDKILDRKKEYTSKN